MANLSNLDKVYKLECLNWKKSYPYKPEVSVRCSLDGDRLHLRYEVKEQSVKAEEGVSGNYVYKDSCVEFFIQPLAGDPHYYNFEWNAIGTLDLSYRTGRNDAEKAPKEVLDSVIAKSSLGNTPFGERMEETSWTLDIDIPASALWRNGIKSWKGLEVRCNFYKCGDGLTVPHYLSWAPIDTKSPDFHRPEFFKPFSMEKSDCDWIVEGNIIKVNGILDGPDAMALGDEISDESLTFLDFDKVTEIKFAGLRALMNCRRSGKKFFVMNACDAVAERFEDTGVSSFVSVTRKPKALEISKYKEFGASFLSKAFNSSDGDAMVKVYGSRVPKWMVAQEKAVAKAVMLFGIPTPLVGTIYEDGDSTALDFEKIGGKRSFSRIMFEEPDKVEEMSVRFARMCKKLHTTQCDTNVFSDKSVYYRRAINDCKEISDAEKSKALAFLESIPQATTCLHGDMQLSNAITNGYEDLWIDLSDFGYGNPLFDLGMWYFLAVYADEDRTRHMFHFGKDTMAKVWRVFIREYFSADTEDKYQEAVKMLEPFGALHMLYLGSCYGFEKNMLGFIREKLLK